MGRTVPHAQRRTERVPSVHRTVRLLEAISGQAWNHSIAELARLLKIPQTTCYRIIQTLIASDWVRPRASGVGYTVSYGLLPILEPFMGHRVLIDVARPLMQRISASTGLGVKLSVRQGADAITVARVEASNPIGITSRPGSRFALAMGSSGAVLLSPLPDGEVKTIVAASPSAAWAHQSPRDVRARIKDVRRHGHCVDLGKYHPMIHSVSVPLADPSGSVVAALTLLGLPGDLGKHSLATCVETLRRVADEVRPAIARRPTHDPGATEPHHLEEDD